MSKNIKAGCLEIFRESFEGVKPGNQYTWYVQGKEAIFDAIESLSPEQASREIPGSRATIGAHANHLCYYLHLFNVAHRGEQEASDWEGSWKQQSFDEAAWKDVIARTHREFDEAHAWYAEFAKSGDDLGDEDDGAHYIANIAHAAYHLGAMRALLPLVQ